MRLRAIVAAALVLTGGTAEADEWFPRFDFHFDAQYVVERDPRFNWMFDFGGDLDVLTSDRMRALFVANYEAIAGEQFRRFDVNQGNYLLEGALLFSARGIDVGPVWHHVSRHLSDRPKRFPVDWNMIAIRALDERASGRVITAWRVDVRKTVTKAFVDYDWEVEAGGDARYRLSPRVAVQAASSFRVVGTDGSRERGTQVEGRVEGALRMEGKGAAAELFVGIERRLDPYPVEFATGRWFLAGLRLRSR